MKKNLLVLTAISAALACSNADAKAGDIYGQLNVDGVILKDDSADYNNGASVDYNSDTGYGLGGAVGTRLTDNVRVEAEFAYRHNNIKALGLKGEYESYAVMGNAIVDIPTGTAITPYIGAGAGYANTTDTDVDDNVFAYQGMAGLSYALSPKTDVVLGYKYFATQTPEYDLGGGLTAKAPYKTHNVELGFRYTFN